MEEAMAMVPSTTAKCRNARKIPSAATKAKQKKPYQCEVLIIKLM